MGYIDTLIENCEKAKVARPLREFVLTDVAELSELAGIEQAIYVIEHDGDYEKIFLDFSRFKQLGTRACARLNAPSPVLYVGSSQSNLAKRIKEHLGRGGIKTYALHLEHWLRDEPKITVRVYNESAEVLQIIEDDLAAALKPAFGKRGGNRV